MMLKLSKKFVKKGDLMTLGIQGFGKEGSDVDACINENHGILRDAALQFLTQWSDNEPDKKEAHIKLSKILRDIRKAAFINELK